MAQRELSMVARWGEARVTMAARIDEERGEERMSPELLWSRECSRRSIEEGDGSGRGGARVHPWVFDRCTKKRRGPSRHCRRSKPQGGLGTGQG